MKPHWRGNDKIPSWPAIRGRLLSVESGADGGERPLQDMPITAIKLIFKVLHFPNPLHTTQEKKMTFPKDTFTGNFHSVD